jgi:hypothetical protein
LNLRSLKIEADGDYWRKTIKPKIRLRGNWLEHAGFKPGNRVSVKCVAAGIMELRAEDIPLALNETPFDTGLGNGGDERLQPAL